MIANRKAIELVLSTCEPFAKGGKRRCFVHPLDDSKCIKVWLPGCDPKALKKQAKFSKRFRKSVRSFDENRNDWETLRNLELREGPEVWEHVPRCFGYQETDLGPGLVVELLRDYDGLISRSFLDLLWEAGSSKGFDLAIEEFGDFWEKHAVPSRQLDLYNISAQQVAPDVYRLVLIDGFGDTTILPSWLLSPKMALARRQRKVARFQERIQMLLDNKKRGGTPGYHGFLDSRN